MKNKVLSSTAAIVVLLAGLIAPSTALAARTINSVTVNGLSSVTVAPGGSITGEVSVTTDGSGNERHWKSTFWRISTNAASGGTSGCDEDPNVTSSTTSSDSLSLTAPSAAGNYNLYVTAYAGDNCSGNSNASTSFPAVTIEEEVEEGTLQIVKNTTGGNGAFEFTVEGPTASEPSITTGTGTGQTSAATVEAGVYSVSETAQTGWSLESSSCTADGGETTFSPEEFTISDGDAVVCTFNNSKLARLKIVKETVGGDDSFTFNVTGQVSVTLNTEEGTATSGYFYLEPGEYDVTENAVSGWTLTDSNCEYGDESAGQAIEGGETITVTEGDYVICTFTNTADEENGEGGGEETYSITGTKFNDSNGNGELDENEEGIAEWVINLFESLEDESIDSAETDQNGEYSFADLEPGTYYVCEATQAGWTQTAPNGDQEGTVECENGTVGHVVTISEGDANGNDFGNQQDETEEGGSISGSKFDDKNSNGSWDEGESGLSGWVMTLTKDGTSITTTTGENGSYSFTGLEDGTYTVCETLKSGWVQNAPVSGGENVVACGTGRGYSVTISEGNDVSGKHFGNQEVFTGGGGGGGGGGGTPPATPPPSNPTPPGNPGGGQVLGDTTGNPGGNTGGPLLQGETGGTGGTGGTGDTGSTGTGGNSGGTNTGGSTGQVLGDTTVAQADETPAEETTPTTTTQGNGQGTGGPEDQEGPNYWLWILLLILIIAFLLWYYFYRKNQ